MRCEYHADRRRIAATLTNYFTRAEVTPHVATIDSKGTRTPSSLTQAITDALVPHGTAAQRDAAIAAALAAYSTSAQTDAARGGPPALF